MIPSYSHAKTIWRRNAKVFSKYVRGALLPTFLDPLFYLFALGFGLGTYVAKINGIPYRDFLAPGLIASACLWSASFETTYNVYFRLTEQRLYDAVLATPVEVQDLVAGDIIWSATRAVIFGTAFLIVVAAFGLISSLWAILIPLFLFVGGLCFSVLGYTFTSLVTRVESYSYYFTLGVTPMFLFSGIFFPFTDLPHWVEVVAWLSPLFHLVEITRGLATDPQAGAIAIHTVWLLAVAIALFPIPVRAFRRRLLA